MSSILKKDADQMRFEDDAIWARILASQEHQRISMTGEIDP